VTQASHDGGRSSGIGSGFSHEPLRERVADVLRAAILDGTLAPGSALVEKAIAADLDISRAPVREAIRMLAQEGLVDSVPYKGSSVRKLSARDVTEVYSMRGLLERYAIRRLLSEPGDAIRRLYDVCDAMQRSAEADDLKGLSEHDERFHRTLIEQADHDLLLDLWGLIGLRARHIMGLRNAQLRDPLRVAANHRAIVDAIASGDLDRSLALMTAHVESGAQLILDDWQDSA
jgi:DNA-binding GntR family transcriptional regulator